MSRANPWSVGTLAVAAISLVGFHQLSGKSTQTIATPDTAFVSSSEAAPAGTAPVPPPKPLPPDSDCVAYNPGSAPPNESRPGWGAAAQTISGFLGSGPDAIPTSQSTLRYVVAIVPDPRHTRLSIQFDRYVDALQAAAQDSGYTYQSSWLPWSADVTHFGSLADQIRHHQFQQARESCPGVLLFRRNPQSVTDTAGNAFRSGLVVFVVADQPTGGINAAQWTAALDWLHHNSEPTEKGSVRDDLFVLGPSFSGSLVSLDRSLEFALSSASPYNFGRATVLSGPVSGCNLLSWFNQRLIDWNRTNPTQAEIRFASFHENDALKTRRLLQYLQAFEGIPQSDVAILSEDETAYGNISVSGQDDPQTHAPGALDCREQLSDTGRPLVIAYPRDISSLRSAYQEQSVFSAAASSDSGSTKSPRIALQSNLADDPDAQGDSVTAYSTEQSQQGAEAALYEIVNHLRAHHSKYVLLRCTNPLDFLFLTRFLHHTYPEGRIVTLGSDLLFRREVDTTEYRGTLSLTDYPLLPDTQHWDRLMDPGVNGRDRDHHHRVFPSDSAQATYSAARSLLQFAASDDPGLPAITPPGDTAPLLSLPEILPEHADPFWLPHPDPFTQSRAPTWLTVVGKDGYWPVAVLTGDPAHETIARQSRVFTAGGPAQPLLEPRAYFNWLPSVWTALLAVTGCLLAWHFWRFAWSTRIFPMDVYPKTAGPARKQHYVLLLFTSAILASTTGTLLLPFLSLLPVLPGHPSSPAATLLRTAGFVLAALLLGAAVSAIVRVWKEKPVDPPVAANQRNRTHAATMVLAGYAIAAALTIASGLSLVRSRPGLDLLLPTFYRAVHLNDGVSLLPPLFFLLIGLYLWSSESVGGNALLGPGCPLLPVFTPHPTATLTAKADKKIDRRHLAQPMAEIIETFARPLSTPGIGLIVLPTLILTLLLFAFYRFHSPILAIDGSDFLAGFTLLLFASTVVVITGATRLLCTWRALQQMLQELAATPMRRTFYALRDPSMQSLLVLSQNVPGSQFELFRRQMTYASALAESGAAALTNPSPAALTNPSAAALTNPSPAALTNPSPAANTNPGATVAPVSAPSEPAAALIRFRIFGEQFLDRELERPPHPNHWGREDLDEPPCSMRVITQQATTRLFEYLEEQWLGEPVDVTEPPRPSGDETAHPDLELSPSRDVRLAEAFVCISYISYLQVVLARIRSIVFSSSAVLISMMLAVAFYPFMPRNAGTAWLVLLLLGLGAVVAVVYAGMERDKILSLITNTPDKLGWQFWAHFITFALPALLALLTAQFPEASDLLSSFIPAFGAK